jgi:ferredoxin/flavodoxin
LKNLIICFSGTGNSYYIAQKISEKTEDCKIEMISNVTTENFETPERLGIVFPIHAGVEPILVSNFIELILGKAEDKNNLKYFYAISNASVNSGFWGLKNCENRAKKLGISLTYSNCLKMPSNFFVGKDKEEANKKIIQKSQVKLDKIIADLKEEKFKFPKWKPKFIGFLNRSGYMSMIHNYGKGFKVSDDCTGCQICYKGCPANNIKMVNNKPEFGDNCLGCTFCINSCPVNAIYRKNEHPNQYKSPVLKFKPDYR